MILCTLVFWCFPDTASADTAFTHWDGGTSLETIGDISEDRVEQLPYCEYQNVSKAFLDEKVYDRPGSFTFFQHLRGENLGEHCTVANSQGRFAIRATDAWNVARHESFLYNGTAAGFVSYKYGMSGPTGWFEPAPQGSKVLETHRKYFQDKTYEITVQENFRGWGGIWADGRQVHWGYHPDRLNFQNQTKLTLSDGDFNVSRHRFSQNGRFLLTRGNEGMVLIDMADYERKMILKVGIEPQAFAVSNDGNFVAYTNSRRELKMIDTSGCTITEEHGSWEKHRLAYRQKETPYPGCRMIGDFKSDLSDAELLDYNSQIKRLYFSDSGNELSFSVKSDSWTPENPVHEYSWTEHKLIADDYVPSAEGYLAMGDSYSSGEGDTIGGTWYEPGTDEQGDVDTFAGRNLCHLSRRSYPYLIAMDMGYLASNRESPPGSGQFHSVACSGAKIHNVIGGGEEKHDAGSEEDFEHTDNQYRFSRELDMKVWQPGATAQVNSLIKKSINNAGSRSFDPAVVTLGIGGNDADFGGFLNACSGKGFIPGTCEHARPDSYSSTRVATMIARQKSELAKTYEKIKRRAPDARVYVHGYPVFIRESGGSCAVNVRLDGQERYFVARATKYMNQVVQAAAQEAGVYYVDVTNIFHGGKLCDESPRYVNGATAGNDKGFIKNILGNESFHPTPEGFKQYKTAILNQTEKFEDEMPPAQNGVPIPLPDAGVFGGEALEKVHGMNQPKPDSARVPRHLKRRLGVDSSNDTQKVSQSGFQPGSSVEVEVHSTPVSLGSFPVDENGVLSAEFGLPDLAPGYHELRIKGMDRFGQTVHVYDHFFVPAAPNDFDGDGIPDDQDGCITIANSGQDSDQDGIDDACDPIISQSPTADPNKNTPSSANNAVIRGGNSVESDYPRQSSLPVGVPGQSPVESTAATTNENGKTLGAQPSGQLATTGQEIDSSVGVQWWIIAIGLSAISTFLLVIKKVTYAKETSQDQTN